MARWKTVQVRAELYEKIKEEALEERGEKVSTAVNRALIFLIDAGFFKYGRTEKWLESFLEKKCKGKKTEQERVLNAEPTKGEIKYEGTKSEASFTSEEKEDRGTGFVLEF
jgi:hypothetical protein